MTLGNQLLSFGDEEDIDPSDVTVSDNMKWRNNFF